MIRKPKIPKFKSEDQEAAWWYEHRNDTAEWMKQAVARGQTTTLTEVLNRARKRSGSPVSLDSH